MNTLIFRAVIYLVALSGSQLQGQDWPAKITSVLEISESKEEDQIWITFVDEKRVAWWLLYRGHSSEVPEHKNTISIHEEPIGEDSLVPMIPLNNENERKILSLIRNYARKHNHSNSDEKKILLKILELKSNQPNQAAHATATNAAVAWL